MVRYVVLLVLFCAVAAGATRVLTRAPTSPRPAKASASVEATTPSGEGSLAVVVVDGDLRGHFTVHPMIDGQRTRMLVDTGATLVALTYEDALAAGYQPGPGDFKVRMATANGITGAASIRIREMRVGAITLRGIEAVVMPRGALGTSLLGMSFLRRLAGFEIQRGRLRLQG
jgi:aspartyl protease family protein